MATSNLALVESTPQTGDEQPPRPNKYTYEEFDGPRGEEYLNVILQQVLPFALWRTWHWAVSFQAPGHPLYVSAGKLAERVRPGERKVYLDLQELEARHLLQITHTRMEIIQSDGGVTARVVTIKNFERLYDLAHEYHEWTYSPDYLPPARECIDLIQASPQLVRKLVRFDNYRRLLLCQKPGRKPRPKEAHDWYAWPPDQEASDQQGPVQENRTDDPKLNLYYNDHDKDDSPKRFSTDSASNNLLNKDSLDSEVPSKEGGEPTKTDARSQRRAYSRKDYTKCITNEEHSTHPGNAPHLITQTNPSNLSSVLETGRPKGSARRESAELDPAVQLARRAMVLVQGEQPGGVKRRYAGDGKPRPRDNELVSSFLNEIGSVLGDRNRKGSITGALRTAQASGLERDIDILMCLVRAYVIARDTREVRPQHRHEDGDNRMPVFSKMFTTFALAWVAGNFHYTEEELIADIAADERLLNWVRERGLRPEVPDHPATVEGEELVEAMTTQCEEQEVAVTDKADEVDASLPLGVEESGSMRTDGMLITRRIRTAEEKEARKAYALKVRKSLRDAGTQESSAMMVENEHPCGCPLFWDTERGWNWKCAHCKPHTGWNGEVRELIASILEH